MKLVLTKYKLLLTASFSGLAITAILTVILVGSSTIHSANAYGNQLYVYGVANNFAAVHFPTLLPNALVSAPAGVDNQFTDMLVSAGVGWIIFEVDPYEVQLSPAAEQRLISAVNYAKEQGVKVHIINQENVGYYDKLNISAPQLSSYQEFHDLFVGLNVYLASTFQPDRLTVLAEPAHYQSDIGSSFTVSQMVQIAVDSARAVKAVNSSIQTWVDVLPTTSFDYSFAQQIAGKSVINGIGYDLYDHSSSLSSVSTSAAYARLFGKKTGMTETWWQDIYAKPQYDNETNLGAEADWINSTYAWSKSNGLSAEYDPFFSEKLVSSNALPLPFTVNATAQYLENLDNTLKSGNRTNIFYSYQNLIGSVSP